MLDCPKRPVCDRCGRPLRGCFCSLICAIENRVELLLLRDKTEAANAKNTGGLLHESLRHSRLCTLDADGALDPEHLSELLDAGGKYPILLYPPTTDALALGLPLPAVLPDLDDLKPATLRLVVIDATWRKSRKILYLNPPLQKLPRLALENPPESLYSIRKTDRKNQLSTLEASCYALQQLEHGEVDYSPLINAMQDFVSLHLAFRPNKPD